MKRFLLSSIVATAVFCAAALGPAGGFAAVRHIPVNHSPAPPLRTVEISNAHPTPAIVSPAATAGVACPQNAQANIAGCPPQSQTVKINLVQFPL